MVDRESECAGDLDIDPERLRSLVESLQEETEAKNKFLRIVAHDLLSPVTSISGLTKHLLKPNSVSNLTDRQLNIIRTMDRAMDRYLETLTNIMELSRLLRGKSDLHPGNINCQELIETSMVKLEKKTATKRVELISKYNGDEEVFVDHDMAEKTFARLLENAVMFTGEGGRVEVDCRADGRHMILEVKDNGVGIEKGRLTKIFDIDEKNHTLGTCDEKGSGMGLCIARRTAILCGGDLTLDSEPGGGTLARLWLPRGE
ncbi:MAG: HAMP domain-containing histidine kinase [Nitrospinota bacterium]|nr:HAMP domain-containing histidine kinase [Nitrospinota bacterium]